MRRRFNLILLIAVCATLPGIARPTWAQDSNPPSLQFLLNLDLFQQQSRGNEHDPASGDSTDSTLDQIQTLNALGYLGAHHHYPDPNEDVHSWEEAPPEQEPSR